MGKNTDKVFPRCSKGLNSLDDIGFFCWRKGLSNHTVDGSEIRREPVDMVVYSIICRVYYIPGGAGFLPPTV